MNKNFRTLILIALGKKNSFDRPLTDAEWGEMYAEAEKQSLVGICFAGIEHLPKSQQPDLDLLMEWLGQTEYIKSQNEIVNQKSKEATDLFENAGFRSVILKGQGVARLYPFPELRTSGDIDIWVRSSINSGKSIKPTLAFLKNRWNIGKVVIHHVDVEMFPEVSVEVHFTPNWLYNPIYNKRLQTFFDNEFQQQVSHYDPSIGFSYPTVSFNLIYSLAHIHKHIYHEGIGMRQLLDYYFILQNSSSEERKEAYQKLVYLGLKHFCGALMYVEQELFEVASDYLICEPDSKRGKFLLEDVEQTGNFGNYDTRAGGRRARLLRLLKYYPSEVMCAPIWKIWHWMWRKQWQ